MTDAGAGTTIAGGGARNGPLGLAIAPDGDILTGNSGAGNMVETAPAGLQEAVKFVDLNGPPGAGDLFGLAVEPHAAGVYFGNDGTNTLYLLH